jgi:hypothetical protein
MTNRRITNGDGSTAMSTPTTAEVIEALETLKAFATAHRNTLEATEKAIADNVTAKRELASITGELARVNEALATAKHGLTRDQFDAVQQYDKHIRNAAVELQTWEAKLPEAHAGLEAATAGHAKADATHKRLEAMIEDFQKRVAAA